MRADGRVRACLQRALKGFERRLRRKERRGGDDDLGVQRVQRPRDRIMLVA